MGGEKIRMLARAFGLMYTIFLIFGEHEFSYFYSRYDALVHIIIWFSITTKSCFFFVKLLLCACATTGGALPMDEKYNFDLGSMRT
jgi:hypothetical protein